MKTMAEPKTKTKMDIARDFKAKEKSIYTEAKEEALAVITDQITALADIGYHYELVEQGQPKPKTLTAKPKTDKPCTFCGQIGHDARKHRAEILAKKAAEKKA